jgi:DUF971 family protein
MAISFQQGSVENPVFPPLGGIQHDQPGVEKQSQGVKCSTSPAPAPKWRQLPPGPTAATGRERGWGAMTTTNKPWPTELRLHKDRTTLTVTFESGERYALSAEYLRVRSPSAEVQGHSPQERKTVPGKKYVQILEVQPVGNYAVRLVFDDTHATGIYSWEYLQELGRTHTRA